MAGTITQEEKDRAITLDVLIQERQLYIVSGTFIIDKKNKIQSFLDSIHLGMSMREHLIKITAEIKDDEAGYKDKELVRLNEIKIENDKILAKEVQL